ALYATDASMYAMSPVAVLVPETKADVHRGGEATQDGTDRRPPASFAESSSYVPMGNRRQCSALAAVFPRGYVHAGPVTRSPVF
ncbi:hypothetical protein, partial [Salinibacter ruber]|uniref:hypothetical protein n=1 Tax=Salinibacter ruber TaxID=146919 RepID=UPI0020738CBD